MRPITLRSLATALALVPLAATACIPYSVGSTAQPMPTGEGSWSRTVYYIPNAFQSPGDTIALPMRGVDTEYRRGLDARSDVGLRITPLGVVVNYKRRLGADTSHARAAWAVMTGAGIVNAGEHAHFEATLIASERQDLPVSAYGGLRAMQVAPITTGAVHDSPTLGVFGGLQIGDASFVLRPELGVFYDRSALGLRPGSFIYVPSVTLQRRRRGEEVRRQRREGRGGREGPDDGRRGPRWWPGVMGLPGQR